MNNCAWKDYDRGLTIQSKSKQSVRAKIETLCNQWNLEEKWKRVEKTETKDKKTQINNVKG